MYGINPKTLEAIECDSLPDDFIEITEDEFEKFMETGETPEISNTGTKALTYKGYNKSGVLTFILNALTGLIQGKQVVADEKMTCKGYDVATYNAGVNKDVVLSANKTVTTADANTNFITSSKISISADARNLPIGFMFNVEVINEGTVTLNLVNNSGNPYTLILSNVNMEPEEKILDYQILSYPIVNLGGNWFINGKFIFEINGQTVNNPTMGTGIIRSGTNPDGTWWKYANGMTIQIAIIPPLNGGGGITLKYPTSFSRKVEGGGILAGGNRQDTSPQSLVADITSAPNVLTGLVVYNWSAFTSLRSTAIILGY